MMMTDYGLSPSGKARLEAYWFEGVLIVKSARGSPRIDHRLV